MIGTPMDDESDVPGTIPKPRGFTKTLNYGAAHGRESVGLIALKP